MADGDMESDAAHRCTAKAGSVKKLAQLAGCTESWAARWRYPKGRSGGTGGHIPRKQLDQLKIAMAAGLIDITAEDLIGSPPKAEPVEA